MIRRILIAAAAALVLGLAVCAGMYAYGVREDASTGPAAAPASPAERIELGRYLARAANCAACHTAPGGQPYAGGTAIPTPFGTFYGPNITASAEQGIGGWSADDFWRALHNGKSRDGSLLYPAFPYTEYTRMTRADSDAIHAYLMSLPASDAPSRPHELRTPYDQRPLLGLWRALYFRPGVQQPDDSQSELWNRGRYLVAGPGHCAACHTPRNDWGATDVGRDLQGAVIAGLGWEATPLTGGARGLGKWSEGDIAELLRSGVSRHGSAAGPMAEVVAGSTQHLSDPDLHAVAAYLKSLPETPAAPPARQPSGTVLARGGKLYEQHCAACHQASGQGMPPAWPPLAGNPSVTAASPANVVQMIVRGGYAPATAQNPRPHGMPPFHTLSDGDVAALASYVRNSWGNQAGSVQSFEVTRLR